MSNAIFDSNGMLKSLRVEKVVKHYSNTAGHLEYVDGKIVYVCSSCHKNMRARPKDNCTNEKHWSYYTKHHEGHIPNKIKKKEAIKNESKYDNNNGL